MRSGRSEHWWTALVGMLALTAAGPVVLSHVSLSGPVAAHAAEESAATPPATPTTGDEAKTIAAEDAAADDKVAEPKDSGEKPAAEEKSDENTADAKAPVEKQPKEPLGDDRQAVKPDVVREQADGSDTDMPSSKESFLTWLYRSLGKRYVVIFLIITFNAVALIVMIVLGLRRNAVCPEELANEFSTRLNEKKYQEAYDLVKQNHSFLGKVLAAGMARLPEGYEAAQEAMQEVGQQQNMRMEQRNGYIALIAQIGPMIGLLGTVDGMVMAFDTIAHSNVTPKPSELAQGIGTALVTTVVGLWIAIPTLTFYHIVRNRLSRLMGETAATSNNLMKRFATVQVSPKKS